jgi:hypothetical protein
MARQTIKNFQTAVRYPFAKRFGFGGGEIDQNVDHDFDNDKELTWSDAADLVSTPGLKVNADNRVELDRGVNLGPRMPVTFTLNANASLATQSFFIADRPFLITGIEYTHATAGTNGAAVTVNVTKDTGTQAAGAGSTVQVGTFNAKGTANTVQYASLLAVDGQGNPAAGLKLAAGDRLSIVFTGTLTTLAGVNLTVYLAPGQHEQPAIYYMNANASIATQSFYQANRDVMVTGVSMIWGTAGTDAGTVTLDVIHDTGTNAPGAGTTILAAAQSAKTTANTVVNPALSATPAQLVLNAGDRLSIKTTGTLTALAGVVVVVYLQSVTGSQVPLGYFGEQQAVYTMLANGSLATQEFFIADRDYIIWDASLIWSVAGTDGGTVTIDLMIDKGTTAPGSGASFVTSGAVSAKTTANTSAFPGVVSASARKNCLLSQGDRLCIKFNGTLTSLAGVTATVSMWDI